MRHNENARVILVKKDLLITKIKENKEKHLVEYKEAVEAFKTEAKNQLDKQLENLAAGEFDLRLNLVKPIDNSEEYDKIIQTFEWEIKDEVELSQGEFNEYVLDETPAAKIAKFSNVTYLQKTKRA